MPKSFWGKDKALVVYSGKLCTQTRLSGREVGADLPQCARRALISSRVKSNSVRGYRLLVAPIHVNLQILAWVGIPRRGVRK